MVEIHVKRGYDVPMTGRAERTLVDAPAPVLVSIRPNEFRAVRPKVLVQVGETVAAGQPLFLDRGRPEIKFPSPGGGEVVEVRRGKRRVCREIFVRLAAAEPFVEAKAWSPGDARKLTREQIVERLLVSGLWTTLRRRPFHAIPDAESQPAEIFVSASDSSPLPFDASLVLEGREADLQLGIDLLDRLTPGKVHVCVSAGAPGGAAVEQAHHCKKHVFAGPYPSGQIEAQIHFVAPHKKGREVWYLGLQDAADIGEHFRTGRYPVARVVAVGGARAAEPRHYRTRRGVSVETLLAGNLPKGATRVVSGNVLNGHGVGQSSGLGHYDSKFCLIPEADRPEFVGWMKPGTGKVSRYRTFLSGLVPGGLSRARIDTNLGGGVRAHVVTGLYEDHCAVDILPAYLMKSLLVEDREETESLGLADCAECGLCTYLCPSKIDFGGIIARGMVSMLKEG